MTHYMELLAQNQPWNLILFMVIPVVCAEIVAISELYILFTRSFQGWVRTLNRAVGMVGGVYFLGVFFYLFTTAVIPLTTTGAWRGGVDMIAVGAYLLGVVPLFGISLLELGIIGRGKNDEEHLKLHAIFVAIFLVVAHVAMIAGMINPSVFGYTTPTGMMMK